MLTGSSRFSFAFYRDSFRFIGVLAGVAVCGFLASSVNFVKLGVRFGLFSQTG